MEGDSPSPGGPTSCGPSSAPVPPHISRNRFISILGIGLLINLVDEFYLGLRCLDTHESTTYVPACALFFWVLSYFIPDAVRQKYLRVFAIVCIAWFACLMALLRIGGSSWVLYPRLNGAACRLRWTISQERLNVFRSSPHWQTHLETALGGESAQDLLPLEFAQAVSPRWLGASTGSIEGAAESCSYLLFSVDPPPNCAFIWISSRNCGAPSPRGLNLVSLGWETFGRDAISRIRQAQIDVMDGMAVYYTYNVGGLPVTWGR